MQGYDVRFQTGTDEHGQKIEIKAGEAGVTPKQFVDNVSGQIKEIWDLMNTSYDKFIRTTDEYHEKQVQKIFKKLHDQGDIYKGYYEANTVHRVNLSLQRVSWWTASVRTAAAKSLMPRKKRISSN